jgi:type III secretory pathway lipoprotein EscJ
VVSARVHLAIPEPDPYQADAQPKVPTAAVLIRHRGLAPPVSAAEVQRLIAGSVAALTMERVTVVMHPVLAPSLDAAQSLSSLGPISVTRSSMAVLRGVLFAAAALNLVLVALVVALLARLRRGRTLAATDGAT